MNKILRLLWPLFLAIPNIVLSCTEQYTPLARAVNIALPLGLYILLYARINNIAKLTLWLVPLMVLCAFQIVLLHLYGESIIAIDMYLNVVTTNSQEVGELLGNLTQAIVTVVVIYLPMIVWAIYALWRKTPFGTYAASAYRRLCGRGAVALMAVGIVLAAILLIWPTAGHRYNPVRQIFPANVVSNLCQAFGRYSQSANYGRTSAHFTYHATATHPDTLPEVYVMVIGETARADNWQLMGYDRATNPRLAAKKNLMVFPRAMSQSNTTHKSVPMMLSALDATNFGDSLTHTKSIFEAYATAGFHTAFISGQRRNGSYIDAFGQQAHDCVFLMDNSQEIQLDEYLLPYLRQQLQAGHKKLFVVLHTYGSHFNYRERYPEPFDHFAPSVPAEAKKENRPQLINAYDNSILYTDYVVSEVIDALQATGVRAAMVYASDHGEDIFDDGRERFLHASPTPTRQQLHVPLVVWVSDEYVAQAPKHVARLAQHQQARVATSSSLFHTMLEMSGIASPYFQPQASLVNKGYREPEYLFVNDYNESVALGVDHDSPAGLRSPDFPLP